MLKQKSSRIGRTVRVARTNNLPRRGRRAVPAPKQPQLDGGVKPPPPADGMDWAEPLDDEKLSALKGGWGFVE